MPFKLFIRVVILTAAWVFAVAKGYLPEPIAGLVYLVGLGGLALVAAAEWVMAAGKEEEEQERERDRRRLERRSALLKKSPDE